MSQLTRQEAIEAFCKSCIYDPDSGGGTWKEQVAQCTAVQCPLWKYRPLPRGGEWANAPHDPDTVDVAEWLARVKRRYAERLLRETKGGAGGDPP